MRILANENVPGVAVDALRTKGHDVVWIRTEAPGSSDTDVLQLAQQQQRIIVTFDKDFGELAQRQKVNPSIGIVLLRTGLLSQSTLAELIAATISSRNDWAGHFSVVEADRIRMVPLSK